MEKEKAHLSIVILGHVDSDKTTLYTQLLYKCNSIDQRTKDRVMKEVSFVFKACRMKY